MTIIWVVAVDHKYGTSLYAATDEDGIFLQLADYCRVWWKEVSDDMAPDPVLTDREVVSHYFDVQGERRDEWYVMEETPLCRPSDNPPNTVPITE
jgi:hypothetical protein